jgi:hypothetical protein
VRPEQPVEELADDTRVDRRSSGRRKTAKKAKTGKTERTGKKKKPPVG